MCDLYKADKMTLSQKVLLSLEIGQTIVVETKNELLMGIVKHIDIKRLMIELDNVKDIKTNCMYTSTQMLSYNQMHSIKVISTATTNTESSTCSGNQSSSKSPDAVSITSNCNETSSKMNSENYMRLTAIELDMIQAQLDGLIYIKQCDQKYHKALQDIKIQSIVGLIIEPVHLGRHCKTSIVAIATSSNIYIFDILYLGKIFREFCQILESQRPKKAVHISHKYLDHMRHRQNCKLNGIFDTFVAYCIVTGDKTPKTLEETIQNILNISTSYFQIDETVSSNPNNRPLTKEYILLIAKKAILQLKLCEYLLHEEMLSNFYEQCENFSRTLVDNNDGYEVAQQLHPHSIVGYNCIEENLKWKDKLQPNLC